MQNALIILCILGAIAVAGIALHIAFRGHREAVENSASPNPHPEGLVSRTAEEAIPTRYLLVKKGSAANSMLICGAAEEPIGPCHDTPASGEAAAVRVLGAAPGTMTVVASKAIAENVRVYTAASGKVTDTASAGCYMVGKSHDTAAADGDPLEIIPCLPVLIGAPVSVSASGGTVTAAQAWLGITVSNAGASGAATFALPAALVGMRVNAVVEAAQELRLDPNGTETIALPSTGVQSAAGKYITADAVGENVMLVCLTAGTWDVLNYTGTWGAES